MDQRVSQPAPTTPTVNLLRDLLLSLGLTDTVDSLERELQGSHQASAAPSTTGPRRPGSASVSDGASSPTRATSDVHTANAAGSGVSSSPTTTTASSSPAPSTAQHTDPRVDLHRSTQASPDEPGHLPHPLAYVLEANREYWPWYVRSAGGWRPTAMQPRLEQVTAVSRALENLARQALSPLIACHSESDPFTVQEMLTDLAGGLVSLFSPDATPSSSPLMALCVQFCRMQWLQLIVTERAIEVDLGHPVSSSPSDVLPGQRMEALVAAALALSEDTQRMACLTRHQEEGMPPGDNAHQLGSSPAATDRLESASCVWSQRARHVQGWVLHRSALQILQDANTANAAVVSSQQGDGAGTDPSRWNGLMAQIEHLLLLPPTPPPPPSASTTTTTRPHGVTYSQQQQQQQPGEGVLRDDVSSVADISKVQTGSLPFVASWRRVRVLTWVVLSIAECALVVTTTPRPRDVSNIPEVADTVSSLACLGLVLAEWAVACTHRMTSSLPSSPLGSGGRRGNRIQDGMAYLRARLLLTLLAPPSTSSPAELVVALRDALHEGCGSLDDEATTLWPAEGDAAAHHHRAHMSSRENRHRIRLTTLVTILAHAKLSPSHLTLLRQLEDEDRAEEAQAHGQGGSRLYTDHTEAPELVVLSRRSQIQRALTQQTTLLDLQGHPLGFSTSTQLLLLDHRTRRTDSSWLSVSLQGRGATAEQPQDEQSHSQPQHPPSSLLSPVAHNDASPDIPNQPSDFASPRMVEEDDEEEEEENSSRVEEEEREEEEEGDVQPSETSATESAVRSAALSGEENETDDDENIAAAATVITTGDDEEEDELEEDEEGQMLDYSSADDCFDSPEDEVKQEVQQTCLSPCRGFLALLTTRGRLAVYALKLPDDLGPGEELVLDTVIPDLPRRPRWFTGCDVSLAFAPDSRFLAASVQFQPILSASEEREAPFVPECTGKVCLFSLHACLAQHSGPRTGGANREAAASEMWLTDPAVNRLYGQFPIASCAIIETQWLDTRFWRDPKAVLRRHAQDSIASGSRLTAVDHVSAAWATRSDDLGRLRQLWRRYAVDCSDDAEAAAWRLSAQAHLAAFQCLSSTRGCDVLRWEPTSGTVLQCIHLAAPIHGSVFSALMGSVYVIDSAGNLLAFSAANEAGADDGHNSSDIMAKKVSVGDRGLPRLPRLLMSEEEAQAVEDAAAGRRGVEDAHPAAFFTGTRVVRFRVPERAAWDEEEEDVVSRYGRMPQPSSSSSSSVSLAPPQACRRRVGDYVGDVFTGRESSREEFYENPYAVPEQSLIATAVRAGGGFRRLRASVGVEGVIAATVRRFFGHEHVARRQPAVVVIDADAEDAHDEVNGIVPHDIGTDGHAQETDAVVGGMVDREGSDSDVSLHSLNAYLHGAEAAQTCRNGEEEDEDAVGQHPGHPRGAFWFFLRTGTTRAALHTSSTQPRHTRVHLHRAQPVRTCRRERGISPRHSLTPPGTHAGDWTGSRHHAKSNNGFSHTQSHQRHVESAPSLRLTHLPCVVFNADACVVFDHVAHTLSHAGGFPKVAHDPRIGVGNPLYTLLSLQASGAPRWEWPSAVAGETRPHSSCDEEGVEEKIGWARRHFARRCVELYTNTAVQLLVRWREGAIAPIAMGGLSTSVSAPLTPPSPPPPPSREKRQPADTALATLNRMALATRYYTDMLHQQNKTPRETENARAARPSSSSSAATAPHVWEVSATGVAPTSVNGRYLCLMAAIGPHRQFINIRVPLQSHEGFYACLVFDTYGSHVVRVIPVCPTRPPANPAVTLNGIIPTHEGAAKTPLFCLPCSLTTLAAPVGVAEGRGGTANAVEETVLVSIGGLGHQVYVFDALSGDRVSVVTLAAPARFVEAALAGLTSAEPMADAGTDGTAPAGVMEDKHDAWRAAKRRASVSLSELLRRVDRWGGGAPPVPEPYDTVPPCRTPVDAGDRHHAHSGHYDDDEDETTTQLLVAATSALRHAEDSLRLDTTPSATRCDAAECAASVTSVFTHVDPFAALSVSLSPSGEDEEEEEDQVAGEARGDHLSQGDPKLPIDTTRADAADGALAAPSSSMQARRHEQLQRLLRVCSWAQIWQAFSHLVTVASLPRHCALPPPSPDKACDDKTSHLLSFCGAFCAPQGQTLGCLSVLTHTSSQRAQEASARPQATAQTELPPGGGAQDRRSGSARATAAWKPFQEPAISELAPVIRRMIEQHTARAFSSPEGGPVSVSSPLASPLSAHSPLSPTPEADHLAGAVGPETASSYYLSAAAVRRAVAREAGEYNHQDQFRAGVVNCVASWCEWVPVDVTDPTHAESQIFSSSPASPRRRLQFVIVAGTEMGQLTLVGGPLEPTRVSAAHE